MSEKFGQGDPFPILKTTYNQLPEAWAKTFADTIAFENVETDYGTELAPSNYFSYDLYTETVDLALDTCLNNDPRKNEKTTKGLVTRGRIDPDHEVDFYSVKKAEYADLISTIKTNAANKLSALAKYLASSGDIHAVPLALLTGQPDIIFSDAFRDASDGKTDLYLIPPKRNPISVMRFEYSRITDEWEQALRKAYKLYSQGGNIAFIGKNNDAVLQGIINPLQNGSFAQFGFDGIPQYLKKKLIIARTVSPEQEVTAMLRPYDPPPED